MSARREHATLLAKQQQNQQQQQQKQQQQQQQSVELGKESETRHPGDKGSLRRWEELLRSADVHGGRWRSDLVGADSTGKFFVQPFFYLIMV